MQASWRNPNWVVMWVFCGVLGGSVPSVAAVPETARVGRVAQGQGTTWVLPAEATSTWLTVQRNDTVTEGDRLRTDAATRLEVQIGSSSVWLGPETEVTVTQLSDEQAELFLLRGSVLLRVREPGQVRDWRVLTLDGTMTPEAVGFYRVDRQDRSSLLRSVLGEARFSTQDTPVTMRIPSGRQAECWQDVGTSRSTCRWIDRQGDALDRFAQECLAQEGGRAPEGLSPEMTGVQELETHGRWEQHPDYGQVWSPIGVGAGWAPFRYGTWSWVARWGWVWVDDAPWGFAPFHYGRWLNWQGRWVWWPGPRGGRLVWLPAAVVWVNPPRWPNHPRAHWPGESTVGWQPLAPHQPLPHHTPPHLPVRIVPTPVPVAVTPPAQTEPQIRLNNAPHVPRQGASAVAAHQPHSPKRAEQPSHEPPAREPERHPPPRKNPPRQPDLPLRHEHRHGNARH